MDSDWYNYYHMTNVSHPVNKSSTYIMPNTSNVQYPPDYNKKDIITSSSTQPPDRHIFSGVEPLSAVSSNSHELQKHMDSTSMPETSAMIQRDSVSDSRLKLNTYQKELMEGMNNAVEYYGNKYSQ